MNLKRGTYCRDCVCSLHTTRESVDLLGEIERLGVRDGVDDEKTVR